MGAKTPAAEARAHLVRALSFVLIGGYLARESEGGDAVRRLIDAIPLGGEEAAHNGANIGIVINDKDRLWLLHTGALPARL
jgi:hypothetical protein